MPGPVLDKARGRYHPVPDRLAAGLLTIYIFLGNVFQCFAKRTIYFYIVHVHAGPCFGADSHYHATLSFDPASKFYKLKACTLA